MIFLYHITENLDTYNKILTNGLRSSASLGKIPGHPEMAKKAHDIFFHPLRENENILDLPYFSMLKPSEVYIVAIAIPSETNLQVNNRLYSFGIEPLYLIDVDEYCKMSAYKYKGLPEVRLTIDNIAPEYIMLRGSVSNHSTTPTENITLFPLEERHHRFQGHSHKRSTLPDPHIGNEMIFSNTFNKPLATKSQEQPIETLRLSNKSERNRWFKPGFINARGNMGLF